MNILCQLISLYTLAIVLRAVASFFPIRSDSPFAPVVSFLHRITEPVFAPVRRVLPQTGAFDFSPLIVLLAIQLVIAPLLGC